MPRAEAIEAGLRTLADGRPWDELLGAVFFAGLRHVRPRPVGFKLHCVFVVESMFQLAAGSPERGARAAMWNLADLKASQARDVAEGDWELPAAPETSTRSKEAVAAELVGALEAWDAERADVAVTAAAGTLARDELFELLWPFALRDFHNLGHKAIFTAHVERVLRRLGPGAPGATEPALRALVQGLLDDEPSLALDAFAASRRAAPGMRPSWRTGRRAPEESLELAARLRSASPASARAFALEASTSGLHSETVWDGIRLAAADLFVRGPGLLPVHPRTVTNSLHYVYRTSRVDETARLALLQAATWIPLFRAFLTERSLISMDSLGLDRWVGAHDSDEEHVELATLFQEPTSARTHVFVDHTADLGPFSETLRDHVVRASDEHHKPKYAAVLIEDLEFADPRWHPALLATALAYLPVAGTRSVEAVRRLERGT